MMPDAHMVSLRSCLRDTRGFMIAEQLISIIFIGLLCIAVAAGLGAAMTAYSGITMQTQADAMMSQAVEIVSDELVYALEASDDASFVSATRHEGAKLDSDAQGIWLDASGARACLVQAENGLTPNLESLSYATDAGTWTFRITVESGASVLAETTMTVKRIGS